MTFRLLAVTTASLALAVAGCDNAQTAENGAAPAEQTDEAAKAAGDQTIAASLDQNGSFAKAAKAAGLDATLANPGPYTVLMPSNEAFAKVEGALKDPAKPENRAELTKVLTYHILPGTVLADDLGKAVDNGKGKALIQTMNGQTLTATKDGARIVLTDGSGGKATITQADQKKSNGVVHSIDAILTPSAEAAPPRQG